MNIYNTLTHKIEKFVPNEPGKVSMYTCGPTVYHYAVSYTHLTLPTKA